MRDKKRLVILTVIFFQLILGVLYVNQSPVMASEAETIRVAFFPMPGFHEYDVDGNPDGYDVEYLERIADYTGWEYEYVVVKNWKDAYDKLVAGEIDLVGFSLPENESYDDIAYSSNPVGVTYDVMVTTIDNDTYTYEDMEALNMIYTGAPKAYENRYSCFNYAEENGFIPMMQYYKDVNEAKEKMHEGKIEAVWCDVLFTDYQTEKVLAKMEPEAFYYMASQYDTRLMQQLDKAIGKIKVNDPGFESSLTEKWFTTYWTEPFNKEEISYIQEKNTITIAGLSNSKPVLYKSGNTEKGIIKDIISILEEKSGLEIELVTLDSRKKIEDALTAGEVDLMVEAISEYAVDQKNSLIRTESYLENEYIFLTRDGENFDKDSELKCAIPVEFSAMASYIEKKYPSFTIVYYETNAGCIEAVESGEADVVLQNQYLLNDVIDSDRVNALIVVPDIKMTEQFYFLGIETTDERLISILNKVIQDLSDMTIEQLVLNHSILSTYEDAVKGVFSKYGVYIVLLAIIAVLIIICFYLKNKKQSEFIKGELTKNTDLQKKSQSDPLTGLLNKAAFKEHVLEHVKKHPDSKNGLIFLDIDNFKMVNDCMGHVMADEVLKDIANVLRRAFSLEDYIGRFGGDEFCVFVVNAPREILAKKAESVCDAIRGTYYSDNGRVSVSSSIGVCIYDTTKTYEEMLELADRALYKSKEGGKDQFNIYE